MNSLIIIGHPNKNSFNHAIAETCKRALEANNIKVLFHDLYNEKFDPVHHIQNVNLKPSEIFNSHYSDLKVSDIIIIIHPNWWGQPPAIVKGWIDRILIPDVAYRLELNDKGDYVPVGLLKANLALIINTSNTPNNCKNDVLDTIWKDNVLKICGVDQVERINFGMVKKSDSLQRALWLEEVKEKINSLFPSKQKN